MNIRDKKLAIIGGAGRVGLPLSLIFAKKGFEVFVIDKDLEKIKLLREGLVPFTEKGAQEILHSPFADKMHFTNSYEAIQTCDILVITIGTPVDEHLNPKIGLVLDVVKEFQQYLRSGQILILRSTVCPGTSNRLFSMLKSSGLEVSVCFCAERISQGNAIEELEELPQVISGTDKRAVAMVRALFSEITREIIEVTIEEAEVTKLFSNAWRYLQFAIANQFYTICIDKGLNFERVREAMMYKYERAEGFPKSGFSAGPCLFKDTMQLAAYCRQQFSLGHAAVNVNETLPEFLIEKAKEDYDLTKIDIGIIGMAFKPNSDDSRESLAYKLWKCLEHEGAKVYCTDVWIKDKRFFTIQRVLEKCDLLFLGCAHSDYSDISLRPGQKIVDCWGVFRGEGVLWSVY